MVCSAGLVESCAENRVKMRERMSRSSTACCVGMVFCQKADHERFSSCLQTFPRQTHVLQLFANPLYYLVDNLEHHRVLLMQFHEHILQRYPAELIRFSYHL
jgi:hypothetical protein